MHQIKILSIGKTKEVWLEQAIAEYLKRLQRTAKIEFILVKDNEQLVNAASKESTVICLDSNGVAVDSEQFAETVVKYLEKGGARLCFVIGGAEGLPEMLRKSCFLVSLSKLTFTHQIVRLILVEQLYRAFEIARGSSYHK